MSVKIHLTKRGKIGILAIVMLLLAGSGGYLLWRVNQEETVSPTDSEAGQSANGMCWSCCTSEQTADGVCTSAEADITDKCNTRVTCGDGVTISVPSNDAAKYCPLCYHSAPGSTDVTGGVECNIGSQCTNKCYWPQVAYCNISGNCECKSGSSNGCTDTEPTCTPVCSGDNDTAECSARCAGCNNLYYVSKSCSTNVCDSGAWVTKPSGVYSYCSDISYSATATDSNGIDESSIVVNLNSVARTSVSKSASGTTATISETLSSSTNCLAPGSYTLDMSWADTKGATGSSCTLSTTFTVAEEDTNPDWSITKGVVEACIDENTENPVSQLTYTITVANTGTGEGSIEKIVDTLDGKVEESYIGTISNDGEYEGGDIIWTLGTTFSAGEEKIYTYILSVPKDAFGKYQNTVTAYPTEGDNVIANADITADCVVEEPNTGLFDSTWGKIVLGVALIALGLSIEKINRIVVFWKKYKISILELQEARRIKRFEKKVVKR